MSEPYDPLSYGVVRLGSGQESGEHADADSPEEMLFGPQDAPAAIAGQDDGSADWDALPDAPLGGACSASTASLDIEPADLVGRPTEKGGRSAAPSSSASLEDALFGAAPKPATTRPQAASPPPRQTPAAQKPVSEKPAAAKPNKKSGKSLPRTRTGGAAPARGPQPAAEPSAAETAAAAEAAAAATPAAASPSVRGPSRPAASAPRREVRPAAARSVEQARLGNEPLVGPRARRSKGTATTVAAATALVGIGLGAWQFQTGELVLASVAAVLGVLGGALSFVVLRR